MRTISSREIPGKYSKGIFGRSEDRNILYRIKRKEKGIVSIQSPFDHIMEELIRCDTYGISLPIKNIMPQILERIGIMIQFYKLMMRLVFLGIGNEIHHHQTQHANIFLHPSFNAKIMEAGIKTKSALTYESYMRIQFL